MQKLISIKLFDKIVSNMDREKGAEYTYYMLSPDEVRAVDEANPGFLAMTNELDGRRKRVVIPNTGPGKHTQLELEKVITKAGCQIVDTTVPKLGS